MPNFVYLIVFDNKNFPPIGAFDARDIAEGIASTMRGAHVIELPLFCCDNLILVNAERNA